MPSKNNCKLNTQRNFPFSKKSDDEPDFQPSLQLTKHFLLLNYIYLLCLFDFLISMK